MSNVQYSLNMKVDNDISISEQLLQQGYKLSNKESLHEIKQYDDLIFSINFCFKKGLVFHDERRDILNRVASRIITLIEREYCYAF